MMNETTSKSFKQYQNSLKMAYKLLTLLGMWTYNGKLKLLYRAYQAFVFLCLLFLYVSEIFAMYMALPNILHFNDVLTPFSCHSLVLFKSLALLPVANRVIRLQDYLDYQVKEFDYNNTLLRIAPKIRLLFFMLLNGTCSTGLFWLCFPWLDNSGRKLPFEMWLPIDVSDFPVYELLYLYQCYYMCLMVFTIVGTDVAFYAFLMQAVAHYDLLCCNLNEIGMWWELKANKDSKDQIKLRKYLRSCINHHKITIRIAREIEDIFGWVCTAQFLGGTLMICAAGFELFILTNEMNIRGFSKVLYLATTLGDIFIFSAFGTLIITKGSNIANEVYNLPWYTMRKAEVQSLMVIIGQAQRPPSIIMGKLLVVNFATYQSMLRAAYSVFSLLRQAYN